MFLGLLIALGGLFSAFILSMPAMSVSWVNKMLISHLQRHFARFAAPRLLRTRLLAPPHCSLQPAERAILMVFPPRSLADLVAQRDILLSYAATHPQLVLLGLCGGYVLMQVGWEAVVVVCGCIW